jgi:hypothetical protein
MAKVTTLRATPPEAPKASPPPVEVAPMVRSTEGLRDVLLDEIDRLRNGSGDRRRALAIAALASQVVNTAKVEIDYQRHLALLGREDVTLDAAKTLGIMRLGSNVPASNQG